MRACSEHVVEKCTLCGQLTSVGEEPKCVAACCASARFYGDLDDPNSDASKALAVVLFGGLLASMA